VAEFFSHSVFARPQLVAQESTRPEYWA